MDPDRPVPGDQGDRVEQGHRLGRRGPVAQVGQRRERAIVAGQCQRLGHTDVTTVGMHPTDQDGHHRARDPTVFVGLGGRLLNLDGHDWSSNPSAPVPRTDKESHLPPIFDQPEVFLYRSRPPEGGASARPGHLHLGK